MPVSRFQKKARMEKVAQLLLWAKTKTWHRRRAARLQGLVRRHKEEGFLNLQVVRDLIKYLVEHSQIKLISTSQVKSSWINYLEHPLCCMQCYIHLKMYFSETKVLPSAVLFSVVIYTGFAFVYYHFDGWICSDQRVNSTRETHL